MRFGDVQDTRRKEGSREGDQGYGDPLPGKANETGFGIEQEA